MSAVQLELFTGEPTAARWQQAEDGWWWCVRCLRDAPPGPKPWRCRCTRRRRKVAP